MREGHNYVNIENKTLVVSTTKLEVVVCVMDITPLPDFSQIAGSELLSNVDSEQLVNFFPIPGISIR